MRVYIDYPLHINFETRAKLPRFKYGCPVRTKLLHKALEGCLYSAPHEDKNFIVEKVEKREGREIWHVGS